MSYIGAIVKYVDAMCVTAKCVCIMFTTVKYVNVMCVTVKCFILI